MKIFFAVIVAAYFALHSALADLSIKAFLHRFISPTYYRIFFNLVSIVLLVPIVWLYKDLPKQHLFDPPIWLISASYLLILIGLVLLIIALRQYNLGEFSGLDVFQKNINTKANELHTQGLNRIVRHPLYFAMLMITWSVFLVNPTDVLLIICVIVSIYIYVGTKLEEQKLVLTFGEVYRAYQQNVPMLLPNLFFQNEKSALKNE